MSENVGRPFGLGGAGDPVENSEGGGPRRPTAKIRKTLLSPNNSFLLKDPARPAENIQEDVFSEECWGALFGWVEPEIP